MKLAEPSFLGALPGDEGLNHHGPLPGARARGEGPLRTVPSSRTEGAPPGDREPVSVLQESKGYVSHRKEALKLTPHSPDWTSSLSET